MLSFRPVVAASVALALVGGAVAGPVLAAAGDATDGSAVGTATSSLTLLDVAVGGRRLDLLQLALQSEHDGTAPATSFVVTPLAADGTAYGRQSVGRRSAVLPVVDTTAHAPAAVSGVAAARSPLVDVRSDGGTTTAGTSSLGAVSVLGLPVALEGDVRITSSVGADGASGGKTLVLTRLALPSVADLLAARGLDLRALPVPTLTRLLDGLDLASPATAQARALLEPALAGLGAPLPVAQGAVDAAGAQVEAVTRTLAEATAALGPVTTALNEATAALGGLQTRVVGGGARSGLLVGLDPAPVLQPVLQPVLAPVAPVLDPVVQPVVAPLLPPPGEPLTEPVLDLVQDVVAPVEAVTTPVLDPVLDAVVAPVVAPVVDAVAPVLPPVLPLPELPVTVPADLQPVVDAYAAARAAYDRALADVTSAQALLAAARATLADATAALDGVLAPVRGPLDAVTAATVDLLDATPLVSLDRLEVTTEATATSAAAGGQSADVVGGRVEGLRVLGTDVLTPALGRTGVDVDDLTAPATEAIGAAVTGVTGALSTALSSVSALPGLRVPAPRVDLLTRATATDVADGFGVAGSALRALTVTWPGLTVPGASLPGRAALRTTAAGPAALATAPLVLGVATLEERVRFRPARAGVLPGTGDGGTPAVPSVPGTPADPGTVPTAPADPGTAPTAPTAGAPVDAPTGPGAPDGTTPPGSGAGAPDSPTGSTGPGSPRTTPVALTELPRTGADGAPVLALLLVAAAVALHRRRATD